MTKIAITPNASGTGTFTLTSPSSNTDRTFTLPDATGEVLTTAGGTFTGPITGTDLTLSGGVYLGGSTAANLLDDYEEGTWTPAFSSATGTWVTEGTYRKVGTIVVATFRANPSGTAGVTANSTNITNLPFTISSTLSGAGYVGVWTNVSESSGVYSFHTTGGTVAYFAGTISTTGIIAGTITYESA